MHNNEEISHRNGGVQTAPLDPQMTQPTLRKMAADPYPQHDLGSSLYQNGTNHGAPLSIDPSLLYDSKSLPETSNAASRQRRSPTEERSTPPLAFYSKAGESSKSSSGPSMAKTDTVPSKLKPRDRLAALLGSVNQLGAEETAARISKLFKSIQQERNREDLMGILTKNAPHALLVASMSNLNLMNTVHEWLMAALRYSPEEHTDSSFYSTLTFLGRLPVTADFLFDPLSWAKTVKKCSSEKLVTDAEIRKLAGDIWNKWKNAAASMPDNRSESVDTNGKKRKLDEADPIKAKKIDSANSTGKAPLPPITKRIPVSTAPAAVPSSQPTAAKLPAVRKVAGPTSDTSFFKDPVRSRPKLPTIPKIPKKEPLVKKEVPLAAAKPTIAPAAAAAPPRASEPTAFEKAMKSLDGSKASARDGSTLSGSTGEGSSFDVYATLMKDMDDREKKIVQDKMAKNLDKKGRPKKSVKWKPDAELEAIKLVAVISYYDDDERVAGAQLPHSFGDARDLDRKEGRLAFHRFEDEDDDVIWHDPVEVEFPTGKTAVVTGQSSTERAVQEDRERQVLAAIYLDRASIPHSPAESGALDSPAQGYTVEETKLMSLGSIEPDPEDQMDLDPVHAPPSASAANNGQGLDLSSILSKLAPVLAPQSQDPQASILDTFQAGGFDLSQIDPAALASVQQILQAAAAGGQQVPSAVPPTNPAPHLHGYRPPPPLGQTQHNLPKVPSLPPPPPPTLPMTRGNPASFPPPPPPITGAPGMFLGGQGQMMDNMNNMMMPNMAGAPSWAAGLAMPGQAAPPMMPGMLPDQMAHFANSAMGTGNAVPIKGKKGAVGKGSKKGLDPTLFRTRTCLLWRNGTCTFGDRCAYLHREV